MEEKKTNNMKADKIDMQLPKLTGREYRPFDWYGWVMCALGAWLLYHFGNKEVPWLDKLAQIGLILFIFVEYAFRVAYGRIYKFVYYDTIMHHMYELKVGEDTYYVCSESEEELATYMDLHYKDIKYTILDRYPVESYIKRDEFQ